VRESEEERDRDRETERVREKFTYDFGVFQENRKSYLFRPT
jgi:hypothetical protein